MPVSVLNFYRFTPLNPAGQRCRELLNLCLQQQIKGTVLLSTEGINGSLAGNAEDLRALLTFLHTQWKITGLEYKWSECETMPFLRMKVKYRRELVSLGESVLPWENTGKYVAASQWDALLADTETQVIDVRNTYETRIGSFCNSIIPPITNFREFPSYVKHHLQPHRYPRLAMFCTGGIRCEKASSWMLQQGFAEVLQLRGGILRYLQETGNTGGCWQGKCFVFDQRVAVDEKLQEAEYVQCHACRHPLGVTEQQSPQYQQGVSCPYCYATLTPEKTRPLSGTQSPNGTGKNGAATTILVSPLLVR